MRLYAEVQGALKAVVRSSRQYHHATWRVAIVFCLLAAGSSSCVDQVLRLLPAPVRPCSFGSRRMHYGVLRFGVEWRKAAARGDVDRICWCIAHRGDVNWSDPSTNGRTPLHAACGADRRQAAVALLLNGANTLLKDDNGINAHDMVLQDPYADLSRLLAEVERGELW